MLPPGPGPAAALARQDGGRLAARAAPRPYPLLPPEATPAELALAATRALVHARDRPAVRHVVATLVRDLGGALVPARFEPVAAMELDVSLGVGEPLLVVADPLSLTAMHLREVLPGLVDDAYAVLRHLPDVAPLDPDTGPLTAQALPRYLELLAAADAPAAQALVAGLLADGISPEQVAEQVLAPAQREVGERWYRGEWSIADEHAATAITEQCVLLLTRPDDVTERLPLVVLASPEGEWHGLPGRLAAAAAIGTRMRVLRPGLPVEQLRHRLEQEQPAAVALSCTMATSLLPAARLVAVAHELGVPVVAGGRAFGLDGRRAAAIGADAWVASPGELAGLLPGLVAGPVPPPLPREALLAEALPASLLRRVWAHQSGVPWVARLNEVQRRGVLDDLRWVSRHAAVAHAVDDDAVLDEPLHWLAARLEHRGAPDHLLADAVRDLAAAMAPDTPAVAARVAAAAERLRG